MLTVTPGWSEAYGLFTKGEAPMVLSYTTSPAYHRIAESTDRYKAAGFSEGHYMQVEVAGITTTGAKNPLARRFMEFMLSPAFQDAIPETNWMFPAAATSKPLAPAVRRESTLARRRGEGCRGARRSGPPRSETAVPIYGWRWRDGSRRSAR